MTASMNLDAPARTRPGAVAILSTPKQASFIDFGRLLLRDWKAASSMAILVVMCLAALLADVLAPYDPMDPTITRRLIPPAFMQGGRPEHWLGTDGVGRDVLSRMLHGSRVSLLVGLSAVLIAGTIGVTLGLLAGYYGGFLDDIIMRIADIQLAFPFILLALTVLAVLGPGLLKLILVLGVTRWVGYGRVVRSQVLSLREQEFVLAARCIGCKDARIVFRHILPNVLAPIIVMSSVAVAGTILTEASLSFLGLGVANTMPTWGGMVDEGRRYIRQAFWIGTFPGIAIMLTVLAINMFGDFLRDYLDPRLKTSD